MMALEVRYNFLVFAVVIATITAVDHQNNHDDEERGIIRYRRGVFKSAGEVIGRKIAQLSRAAEELSHQQRARSVLKADAKFSRNKRVYEKRGGIDRAESDFLLMDVKNVEMQLVDKLCVIKKGIVGVGKVRFMACKGKSPIIFYKQYPPKRRSSTIQVLYKN